jgi:hypothetical protein
MWQGEPTAQLHTPEFSVYQRWCAHRSIVDGSFNWARSSDSGGRWSPLAVGAYEVVGRLVFSGQLTNCYVMLRTAGSGIRCRPLAGSGIRVPSGDVDYCSGIRYTGQHLFGRVHG